MRPFDCPALCAGTGDAALVWFPAVGDSVSSFGRAALGLASRMRGCMRVVAFDPPGYGAASRDPIPPFSFLYDWAAARLDWYAGPGVRVVLAGNSSGADLALAAAVRSNAHVVGCTFVCWPDWRLGSAPGCADLCPRDADELELLLNRSWHAPPRPTGPQRQRMLARLNDENYRRHVASFDPVEHGRMLDQLGVPLALVGGRSDGLVERGLLEQTAIEHRCSVEFVEQAGHYPQIERPRELAERLAAVSRRWLRLLPGDRVVDLVGAGPDE